MSILKVSFNLREGISENVPLNLRNSHSVFLKVYSYIKSEQIFEKMLAYSYDLC